MKDIDEDKFMNEDYKQKHAQFPGHKEKVTT